MYQSYIGFIIVMIVVFDAMYLYKSIKSKRSIKMKSETNKNPMDGPAPSDDEAINKADK